MLLKFQQPGIFDVRWVNFLENFIYYIFILLSKDAHEIFMTSTHKQRK